MKFTFKEELQEFFESAGFRNINNFPSCGQQVYRLFYSVLLSVDILDVHDAGGVVKVVIFAQGEAGIVALSRYADAFIDFGIGVQSNNVCSGLHGFACNAVAHIQRIHNNFSAESRAFGLFRV